jgi:uncharacterized protein (TIGR02118 family)
MLILLGFYKRKPGLTLEEFQRHWREIHGPLIAAIPDIDRYIKRYVQHHFVPSTGWPCVGALEYDGFSEVWYASVEARKALHALPYHREIMVPDEHKFVDMEATRLLMLDEQVVQIGTDHSADWASGRV